MHAAMATRSSTKRSSRRSSSARGPRPRARATRTPGKASRVAQVRFGDDVELARTRKDRGTVRYAVVGLGYFAQAAVLPAFKKAKNAELVALVSDDPTKLRELGDQYNVGRRVSYDEYDDLLASGEVDAVYICVPNHLHAEYTIRAARHGVHVLCEKPLAVTAADCRRMIDACERGRVRLMTAYRLHFNDANLDAVKAVQDGDIGKPRFFTSSFAMQVKPSGIRTNPTEKGGGPLYDVGIYCINAARYLFRAEPRWVFATMDTGQDQARFREIDEAVTCVLGFDEGRTATFTASFGAADVACYEVYGTSGCLCLDNAYEYATTMRLEVEGERGNWSRRYMKRDQIVPELVHFSDCVLQGRDPEPNGKEGLIDVAVIEAALKSAASGRRVQVRLPEKRRRPTKQQAMRFLPHRMPELVNAKAPHQG
jgi:predicted dehydrogenase